MALDPNKKYRLLACCGCGNGTCQMLAMKIKAVCRELNIRAEVEPAPVSVGLSQSRSYDAVICNVGLVDKFSKAAAQGALIIGIKNVLSVDEIREKLQAAFHDA